MLVQLRQQEGGQGNIHCVGVEYIAPKLLVARHRVRLPTAKVKKVPASCINVNI